MQQETDNYSGERAVAFAQISKTKRYVLEMTLSFKLNGNDSALFNRFVSRLTARFEGLDSVRPSCKNMPQQDPRGN